MLEFPEESIRQAREIAEKYRQRTKSKRKIAAQLYDLHFLHINYGFDESIKTGNCGRYLHEIVKEAECFTMAGVLYLIAREAKLEPRIYWATGMRDTAEGEDSSESGTEDHSFILVKTGKDREHVIDPQMGQYGEVRIFPDKNSMQIYDRKDKKVNERSYAHLQQISQEEYLQKLEENRTPNGGRIALSATQRIKGKKGVYVTYNPERESLTSSLRYGALQIAEDQYEKVIILDLETKVGDDGDFDFSQGEYSFYFASGKGWTDQQDPLVPIRFSASNIEKFFGFLDVLFRENGRKTPASRSYSSKLEEALIKLGFHNSLRIFSGSSAERIVCDKKLEEILGEIGEDQFAAARDYVERCKEDERSYRALLRDAHYVKDSDLNVSKENPWGFISSEKERDEFARESFRVYKKCTINMIRAIFERREVEAGFKNGSEYHAERRFNRDFETQKRRAVPFDQIIAIRKKFPFLFARAVDRVLSNRRYDLANMTIEELSSGISDEKLGEVWPKSFVSFFNTSVCRQKCIISAYI